MDEQNLFEQAMDKPAGESRTAWLDEVCGVGSPLRKRIDALLRRHQQANSFLETPPVEQPEVFVPNASDDDLAASLNAGPAAAFPADAALVMGNIGHSVLKAIGQTIDVPRVVLREAVNNGRDPIVRPKSPEMPDRNSDSRYRLDGEIARGGMGAILKGRDTDLGRDLAIKVLLDEHKNKPEVIQRFVEEAQIGGQLQHPGIAPIYELGQFSDKRPFFSMKLVKGDTLSKLLTLRKDPTEDRGRFLGIFEQVCQTMAYAHSRGVIHRDLKPANIMVGAFGEVQVMDWGLAKVLSAGGIADEKKAHSRQQGQSIIQTLRSGVGSDTPGMFGTFGSQTQMGSVMGTPAYMPPEQALGEIDNLDERADVFGLGAILSEILTGKPPYVSDDGAQVFRLASRGKLGECFARLDACGADDELIDLAKQCLNPEPSGRPSDAGVLAEQVAHYLESVETKLRATEMERATQAARAESESRRVVQQRRAAQKLRMALGGVAIVALVAGVACVAALVANKKANDFAAIADVERKTAKKEAADAETARKLAENSRVEQERLAEDLKQRQGVSEFVLARNAYEQGDLRLAGERLANIPLAQRRWESGYLRRLTRGGLFTLYGHFGPVRGVAYSADGTRIATGAEDKSAKVWDAKTGTLLFTLQGHTNGISSVAFNPDGTRIVTGGWDMPKVWDAQTGKHLLDLNGHTRAVSCVFFSPDGTHIATGSDDATTKVWDASTGTLLLDLQDAGGSVAFSPDGTKIGTASANTAKVWDIKTGGLLLECSGHTKNLHCLTFSPDGTRIATGSQDRTARMWDANNGTLLFEYSNHHHAVTSVRFSFDGARIVTGCIDGSARVWDAQSDKLFVELKGTAAVMNVAFSPDGTQLITGSDDCTATVWDARTGSLPLELPAIDGGAKGSVQYSRDGSKILTSSGNSTAAVWDAMTLTRLTTLEGHTSGLHCAAYSLDGTRIVTGGFDTTAKIWDATKNGPPLIELKGHAYEVCGASFSPDGKFVVTCGGQWRDPTRAEVKVWNALTGEFLFDLDGHTDLVYGAVFSPDGTAIATAGWDGTAKVWGARTGKLLLDFKGHSDRVHCVAFTPDGTRVMTGSADHTIKVWDSTSGTLLLDLKGQDVQVFCATFSPDGKRIVTGGGEWGKGKSGATVWDVQTGTPLVNLSDFQGRVTGVTFSPDGTQIATSSRDEVTGQCNTRIWNSRTGNPLLGELKGHTGHIQRAAFSPDGTRIVTGSTDRTAKVWDARTQKLLFSLEGHPGGVGWVAFSPDGKHIGTESHMQLKAWNAETGEQLPDTELSNSLRSELASRFFSNPISPDGRIFAQSVGNSIELIQVQPDDDEIAYRRLLPQTNWPALLERYYAARVANDDRATEALRKLLAHCPASLRRTAFEKAFTAGDPQFAVGLLASVPTDEHDSTLLPLRVAALQAWCGRDQELIQSCRQSLEWAKDATTPQRAERAAKACCIRPLEDANVQAAALVLARRAVELSADHEQLNWFETALGMAEYRSGHFAEAERILAKAPTRDLNNQNVVTTSAFFRAMCLFQQDKQDEARQLANEAASKMKPMPDRNRFPLPDGVSHDDLIMWMAYQEAKALIQF